jgi:SAM-dependent methyltransferase
MERYKDSTYGDRIAEVYDDFYFQVDPDCVDLLAGLAGDGGALELGIGTGRIALPLQAAGVSVQGIDASVEMVARLRAKPAGEHIRVHIGSFETFQLPDRFQLIYVVFNTFFALLTQRAQINCFQSVAAHLAPGGAFLVEVFVPNLARFEYNQAVLASRVEAGLVMLDASRHDPVTQQVSTQHVLLSEAGSKLYPVNIRYVWPSELDLMARIAGLSLRHRWSSWTKAQFTADSRGHISVYELDEQLA